MKNIFLAEVIKADHQLSGSFYQNIICLDWVMNLFLFWVMFSVKKVSFPAKTAVLNGSVKIFYQTVGGEYNSISLHFGKLRQYVFFLFQSLDVTASENLSPWGWNVLGAERLLCSWHHIGWRNTKICIHGASQMKRKRGKCWKSPIFAGKLQVFISYEWNENSQYVL